MLRRIYKNQKPSKPALSFFTDRSNVTYEGTIIAGVTCLWYFQKRCYYRLICFQADELFSHLTN